VTDGTTNTVMMSEVLRCTISEPCGGVPGDLLAPVAGGAWFSTYTTPNSPTADVLYSCPQDAGDRGYKAHSC
jgi:hypothetical protein